MIHKQSPVPAISAAGLMLLLSTVGLTLTTTLAVSYHNEIIAFTLWQWAVVFAFTIITMAIGLTSSTSIAMFTGYFLGAPALLFIVVTYPVAAWLGYLLGQYLRVDRFLGDAQHRDKVQKLLVGLADQPWSLMFFVRLSPVLPFAIMNMLMASLKIRLSVFLLGGTVGMLPRTLFSVWAGTQANSMVAALQGEGASGSAIFVGVASVISVAGLVYLGQRAWARQLMDRMP